MTVTEGPAQRAAGDIALARQMAAAARAAILPHFRAPDLDIADKTGAGPERFDPVTEADRAAEAAMRALIEAERPEDGILGEEFGRREGTSGRVWVLDPVDGTRAFVAGLPTWGVLISLHDGARPILGVMDQPFLEERFLGWTGREPAPFAAYSRGPAGAAEAPLRTRPCKALSEATLFSTDPRLFGEGAEREAFERLQASVRLTRYGMDCYGYAMVAAGHGDLVVEPGLAAYDIQSHIALIEASGGAVTNEAGAPVDWGGTAVAAGDPALHVAALACLAGG